MEKLRHRDIILARERAHAFFDQLESQGWMSKNESYLWLSSRMKMPRKEAHIGRLNPEQCEQVVEMCKAKLLELTQELRGKYAAQQREIDRLHGLLKEQKLPLESAA